MQKSIVIEQPQHEGLDSKLIVTYGANRYEIDVGIVAVIIILTVIVVACLACIITFCCCIRKAAEDAKAERE